MKTLILIITITCLSFNSYSQINYSYEEIKAKLIIENYNIINKSDSTIIVKLPNRVMIVYNFQNNLCINVILKRNYTKYRWGKFLSNNDFEKVNDTLFIMGELKVKIKNKYVIIKNK